MQEENLQNMVQSSHFSSSGSSAPPSASTATGKTIRLKSVLKSQQDFFQPGYLKIPKYVIVKPGQSPKNLGNICNQKLKTPVKILSVANNEQLKSISSSPPKLIKKPYPFLSVLSNNKVSSLTASVNTKPTIQFTVSEQVVQESSVPFNTKIENTQDPKFIVKTSTRVDEKSSKIDSDHSEQVLNLKKLGESDDTLSASESLVNTIGKQNYHIILNALCQLTDESLRSKALAALFHQKVTRSKSCQTEASEWNPEDRRGSKLNIKQEIEYSERFTKRKRKSKVPCAVMSMENGYESKLFPLLRTYQNPKVKAVSSEADDELPDYDLETASLCSIGTQVYQQMKQFQNLDTSNSKDVLQLQPILYNQQPADCSQVLYNDPDINMQNPLLASLHSVQSPVKTPLQTMQSALEKNKDCMSSNMLWCLKKITEDCKVCLELDNEGYMPIHIAVFEEELQLVRRCILIMKFKKVSIDQYSENGYTPLHLAILKNSSPPLLKLLLQNGSSLSAVDDSSRNALHLAARGPIQVLHVLVCHLPTDQLYALLTAEDQDGHTPLMVCVLQSHIDHMEVLLQRSQALLPHQADSALNFPSSHSGKTALILAAAFQPEINLKPRLRECFTLLKKYGADPDVADFNGNTAKDMAIDSKNLEFFVHWQGNQVFTHGPHPLSLPPSPSSSSSSLPASVASVSSTKIVRPLHDFSQLNVFSTCDSNGSQKVTSINGETLKVASAMSIPANCLKAGKSINRPKLQGSGNAATSLVGMKMTDKIIYIQQKGTNIQSPSLEKNPNILNTPSRKVNEFVVQNLKPQVQVTSTSSPQGTAVNAHRKMGGPIVSQNKILNDSTSNKPEVTTVPSFVKGSFVKPHQEPPQLKTSTRFVLHRNVQPVNQALGADDVGICKISKLPQTIIPITSESIRSSDMHIHQETSSIQAVTPENINAATISVSKMMPKCTQREIASTTQTIASESIGRKTTKSACRNTVKLQEPVPVTSAPNRSLLYQGGAYKVAVSMIDRRQDDNAAISENSTITPVENENVGNHTIHREIPQKILKPGSHSQVGKLATAETPTSEASAQDMPHVFATTLATSSDRNAFDNGRKCSSIQKQMLSSTQPLIERDKTQCHPVSLAQKATHAAVLEIGVAGDRVDKTDRVCSDTGSKNSTTAAKLTDSPVKKYLKVIKYNKDSIDFCKTYGMKSKKIQPKSASDNSSEINSNITLCKMSRMDILNKSIQAKLNSVPGQKSTAKLEELSPETKKIKEVSAVPKIVFMETKAKKTKSKLIKQLGGPGGDVSSRRSPEEEETTAGEATSSDAQIKNEEVVEIYDLSSDSETSEIAVKNSEACETSHIRYRSETGECELIPSVPTDRILKVVLTRIDISKYPISHDDSFVEDNESEFSEQDACHTGREISLGNPKRQSVDSVNVSSDLDDAAPPKKLMKENPGKGTDEAGSGVKRNYATRMRQTWDILFGSDVPMQ